MNYRHIYHAGNFADVLKHVALGEALSLLAAKDKPMLLLDTHAGAGAYDLGAGIEADRGVRRILAGSAPPPAVARYLEAVRAYDRWCGHRGPGIVRYPGSPRFMKAALRRQDRLVLCELQGEQVTALRRELAGDSRVSVCEEDGYAVLKALLPPAERRGLVLIDPPYERSDDRTRAVRALAQGHRRFATGVYLLWYPIKADAESAAMIEEIAALALPRTLLIELRVPAEEAGRKPASRRAPLTGCGLAVVNPPWQLEAAMTEAMPWLARTLGGAAPATSVVRWLVPEPATSGARDR
jgi:23S rRNA (adenine2030-N6)-methyltransferase